MTEQTTQTRVINYIYRITGVGRDGKERVRDYISSSEDCHNAIALAREDGISPTMCFQVDITRFPIDPRLVGIDPDKIYEPDYNKMINSKI